MKVLNPNELISQLFYYQAYISRINSEIQLVNRTSALFNPYNPLNATSKEQARKLQAINRLLNAAVYLNGYWIPNWNDSTEIKYYLAIDYENITPEIIVRGTLVSNSALVYFKSKEAAQEAIGILGYTEIIYALSYI